MRDVENIIASLRYEPFRGEELRQERQAMLDYIAHRQARHGLRDEDFLSVSAFGHFALLNEMGWHRIRYESFRLETGHMYWMTDEQAAAVGRAMRPTLRALRIDLTTLAGDGFTVMAENLAAEVQLDSLCIAHRSGDAVTVVESRGLARLATLTRVAELSLWANAFDGDALDALADELWLLDNRWLKDVDVCDLCKEEPDDKILHSGLAELAERNRMG
jgi:hypothetical protein